MASHVSDEKYAAACARMVKGLSKRVGSDSPESLRLLMVVQDVLDHAWATAVQDLRRAGEPDHAIGAILGITRQAVQQRWPHSVGVTEPAPVRPPAPGAGTTRCTRPCCAGHYSTPSADADVRAHRRRAGRPPRP